MGGPPSAVTASSATATACSRSGSCSASVSSAPHTAREAIKIMGEIAERVRIRRLRRVPHRHRRQRGRFFEIYGAGPFEIGAVWAAQRVPDDEIGVSANRARIGEIRTDDPDNFISENIFQVAKDFGWWDESQGPLHFARRSTAGRTPSTTPAASGACWICWLRPRAGSLGCRLPVLCEA